MRQSLKNLIVKGYLILLMSLFFLSLIGQSAKAFQPFVLKKEELPAGFSLNYQHPQEWETKEGIGKNGMRQSWRGRINGQVISLVYDLCIFDSPVLARKAAEHKSKSFAMPYFSGSLTGTEIGDKCWSGSSINGASIIFYKNYGAVHLSIIVFDKEKLDPSLISWLEKVAQKIVDKFPASIPSFSSYMPKIKRLEIIENPVVASRDYKEVPLIIEVDDPASGKLEYKFANNIVGGGITDEGDIYKDRWVAWFCNPKPGKYKITLTVINDYLLTSIAEIEFTVIGKE